MKKSKLNLLVIALLLALFSAIPAVSAADNKDNPVIDESQPVVDESNTIVYDNAAVDQAQTSNPLSAKPFLEGATPAQIEAVVEKMSYGAGLNLAEKYGIDTIRGKKVIPDRGAFKNAPTPKTLADRPVGSDPGIAENEPSISAKPNNSNIIVAASHSIPGTPCVAYYSLDHGETWSGKVPLPLPAGTSCSDPVIRWAPDGGRVYAAYMSINSSDYDIVVSTSTNNGATWSTPVIALAGSSAYIYDKPWIDVHTFWSGQPNRVYVTATRFYNVGGMDIAFTRSTNGGASWAAPLTIAASPTGIPTYQGSRPIGGKPGIGAAGNVTVCWYNSNTDGFLIGNFSINCRNSIDYGVSFGSIVTAFNSTNYGGAYSELPYYLGPSSWLHRWWGGMFPSIITTYDGVLHIVYTAAPVNNTLSPATTENGNIYYVKSAYPYTRWSLPVQLNDDYSGKAQGYPTITAKRIAGGSILTAFWEDHRLSPYYSGVPGVDCGGGYGVYGGGAGNCLYDIFSASTNPGWGPNQKVTDASSVSSYTFIGDYIDSSTSKLTGDRWTHVAWTDRNTVSSIFDYYGSDIYSDQVNS